MLLGAHESVAGGVDRAYAFAQEDGCDAIQVFTKNASQWREPELAPDRIQAFVQARANSTLASAPVLAHDSYLINLCTSDETMRQRSRDSLLAEARRCALLGIEYVVLHPGAHMGAGVQPGIDSVVELLTWVLRETRRSKVSLLIENTAGQGSCIGARFEEIGAILEGVERTGGRAAASRIGLCLDTCHAFAADYDLSTRKGFDRAWSELDSLVGLHRLKALHLNDSKKELGSRVDRHERIGQGKLGLYPFWRLVNDKSLDQIPGVLETPHVGQDRGYREQLEVLRGFRGKRKP